MLVFGSNVRTCNARCREICWHRVGGRQRILWLCAITNDDDDGSSLSCQLRRNKYGLLISMAGYDDEELKGKFPTTPYRKTVTGVEEQAVIQPFFSFSRSPGARLSFFCRAVSCVSPKRK